MFEENRTRNGKSYELVRVMSEILQIDPLMHCFMSGDFLIAQNCSRRWRSSVDRPNGLQSVTKSCGIFRLFI